MNKKQVYIAGDMLTTGSQMLRAKEKEDIAKLGYAIYNPQDNKDINDKKAQGNAGDLAERIVKQDTKALIDSDIIVIEPQPFALGTLVELGQLKGMKDLAELILKEVIANHNSKEALANIIDLCIKQHAKKVLTHYEDIRRIDVTETGDRRSLGINAYVYGTCLDLSHGRGFYDWEEILKTLEVNNYDIRTISQ